MGRLGKTAVGAVWKAVTTVVDCTGDCPGKKEVGARGVKGMALPGRDKAGLKEVSDIDILRNPSLPKLRV